MTTSELMISSLVRRDFSSTVENCFTALVALHTTSDLQAAKLMKEAGQRGPSTKQQWNALHFVERECNNLGLSTEVDPAGLVYAIIPASKGVTGEGITYYAHVDTTPDVCGEDVNLRRIDPYDGNDIHFPDNSGLVLSPDEYPYLLTHRGKTIFTASGNTLLGADCKSGVAILLALARTLVTNPELRRCRVVLCFTTDEEIGQGGLKADSSKITPCGYTVDGGPRGELSTETFVGWGVTATITGRNVHPGVQGYRKIINAGEEATRFVQLLDSIDTPRNSKDRDGFWHLLTIAAKCELATMEFILCDFDDEGITRRLKAFEAAKDARLAIGPNGLEIDIKSKKQYPNMKSLLNTRPEVAQFAEMAIYAAGMEPVPYSIRGGTDGAMLTLSGKYFIPNIFTGQQNIHSLTEWIGLEDMVDSGMALIHLANIWANAN